MPSDVHKFAKKYLQTTCLLYYRLQAFSFLLFQNNENEDVETDVTPNLSMSGDGCVTQNNGGKM
jgi:hypothetical protein